MFIVEVKHYLNPAGTHYFPLWFEEVVSIINKQNGFHTINYHFNVTHVGLVHIHLEYVDKEKLETWCAKPEHDYLLELLEPYRTQAWETIAYNSNSPQDVSTATISALEY